MRVDDVRVVKSATPNMSLDLDGDYYTFTVVLYDGGRYDNKKQKIDVDVLVPSQSMPSQYVQQAIDKAQLQYRKMRYDKPVGFIMTSGRWIPYNE